MSDDAALLRCIDGIWDRDTVHCGGRETRGWIFGHWLTDLVNDGSSATFPFDCFHFWGTPSMPCGSNGQRSAMAAVHTHHSGDSLHGGFLLSMELLSLWSVGGPAYGVWHIFRRIFVHGGRRRRSRHSSRCFQRTFHFTLLYASAAFRVLSIKQVKPALRPPLRRLAQLLQ